MGIKFTCKIQKQSKMKIKYCIGKQLKLVKMSQN